MRNAEHTASSTISIGAILELLRSDFPDVSISKIRFLEAEGLVTPERTSSGYRRYSGRDIERLRFILMAQRDHYLPLKVIRAQLDAMDAGESEPGEFLRMPRGLGVAGSNPPPDSLRPSTSFRLTAPVLCERAGVDEEFVTELQRARLLEPSPGGFFTEDDVTLVIACHTLSDAGIDIRHLRSFRSAADREAGLIEQAVEAPSRLRSAESKGRAAENARTLAAAAVTVHAELIKARIRDILGE